MVFGEDLLKVLRASHVSCPAYGVRVLLIRWGFPMQVKAARTQELGLGLGQAGILILFPGG
jgi:hypothetical protein